VEHRKPFPSFIERDGSIVPHRRVAATHFTNRWGQGVLLILASRERQRPEFFERRENRCPDELGDETMTILARVFSV
jgi:hypothetical protein